MLVFETGFLANSKYLINFPTKRHWRDKSRIEDIETGLSALVAEIRQRGVRSIAIPPLGSGLGGLDWNQVRPRIEAAVRELRNVQIIVFEPMDASQAISRNGEWKPNTSQYHLFTSVVFRF